MKKITHLLAVTLLGLTSFGAQAIELFVDPSTQFARSGDSITVDINISDLGSGVAPSVGAFDITVEFDSALLSAKEVVFGDQLDLFNFGTNLIGVDFTTLG